MKTAVLLALLLMCAAALFAGCGPSKFERYTVAKYAQKSFVGRPRNELLACVDARVRVPKDGDTAFLTYVDGGDSADAVVATPNGSAQTINHAGRTDTGGH
jgi:hypothetical protein